MPDRSFISLHDVDKRFANGTAALAGVRLQVAEREFVSLLGPSGCGKSTVLRLAAALDVPSAGHVESPATRGDAATGTAFVFQEPTLMPWANVFDNIWLPLRLAGVSRKAATERICAMLHSVGLEGFESAFPAQLSGGMKMRTSIARALVTAPRVLLMDEPFAALDEITRQRLNDDLLRWWQLQPMAVMFVTHSVFEAVFLSQRVLVMGARPGRVVAELRIDEPYPRPPDFRSSPQFWQACRKLSATLQAHADSALAASRA